MRLLLWKLYLIFSFKYVKKLINVYDNINLDRRGNLKVKFSGNLF